MAPADYSSQVFTIVIVTIGAIEMAIGLGLVMLLYRFRRSGDEGLLWAVPALPLAAVGLIVAVHPARRWAGSENGSSSPWGLRADGVATAFALLVAGISAIVDLYAVGYVRDKEGSRRFFAWMAFFQGSCLSR